MESVQSTVGRVVSEGDLAAAGADEVGLPKPDAGERQGC